MLPLTTADLLANAIIGSVLENLDMESLVRREFSLFLSRSTFDADPSAEIGQQVADRIGTDVTEDSIDAVAQELHEKLLLMGQTTKKVRVENIYEQSPQFEANVKVLMTAATLEEAKPQLEQVSPCFPSIPKSHLTPTSRSEHQSSQKPTETQSTAAATATAAPCHHVVLPRRPHPPHTPLPHRSAYHSMTMMPPTIPLTMPRTTMACPRAVAKRHESPSRGSPPTLHHASLRRHRRQRRCFQRISRAGTPSPLRVRQDDGRLVGWTMMMMMRMGIAMLMPIKGTSWSGSSKLDCSRMLFR